MRTCFGLALVAGLAVATRLPAGDAAEELKKLQGTWQVTRAAYDGKENKDATRLTVVIDGEKLTLKDGARTEELTFTITPGNTPKEIEVTHTRRKETSLGIYAVEGDELKVCWGHPKSEDERPRDFEPKPGSRAAVMVLKKKDEK